MADRPPSLRDDLIVRRHESDGEESYILKDPRKGAFFRLREVEHHIATQLDGVTTLDEIRERTARKFDAELPMRGLTAFVARLERAGLLAKEHERPHRERPRRWLRGSLLYLRLPICDPDAFFSKVAERARFLFTPGALAVATGFVVLAAWITLLQGGAIQGDVRALGQTGTFVLAISLILISVSLHECAHGLACKHFGGGVHEMGFMLIYFQPAFYCNVSDAWLIPEKAKRLWVSFAGIILELTVWALATLVWRVTETGTWPNLMAIVFLTTAGVKTLLNLNPFVKLDGYYLLSDWLDLPNLRRKAFRYIGEQARWFFGFPADAPLQSTPRERRIFLAYGLVAAVSSTVLLVYVAIQAGQYLLAVHRPAAFAVFAGFVGLKARRRIRRLFGNGNGTVDEEDGIAAEALAASEGNGSLPPAPTSSRDRRFHRRVAWGGFAAVLLGGILFGHAQLRIGGSFTLLPSETGEVRTSIEGIVAELLVDEGTEVRAGDPIARLATRDIDVDLRKTEAQVAETRAMLRKLEAGPTAAEVEVARAGESRAADRLRFAETALRRTEALAATASATQQEVDVAQELATTAANDLTEARGRLHLLERGTRPEEVDAVRARLTQLDAQREYLAGQRALVEVTTNVGGTVATPSRQLLALRGQHLDKGALVARVFNSSTVVAQIVIPEPEIADVHVGQPVVVRARAFPDRVFTGKVTAIATAAQGTTAVPTDLAASTTSSTPQTVPIRMFVVTTEIVNDAQLLRPGMTGYVKVLAGERRIIALMVRRLARIFKVEVWSWW